MILSLQVDIESIRLYFLLFSEIYKSNDFIVGCVKRIVVIIPNMINGEIHKLAIPINKPKLHATNILNRKSWGVFICFS